MNESFRRYLRRPRGPQAERQVWADFHLPGTGDRSLPARKVWRGGTASIGSGWGVLERQGALGCGHSNQGSRLGWAPRKAPGRPGSGWKETGGDPRRRRECAKAGRWQWLLVTPRAVSGGLQGRTRTLGQGSTASPWPAGGALACISSPGVCKGKVVFQRLPVGGRWAESRG